MKVSIVKEWYMPDADEAFKKNNPKDSMFYLVKLQTGRQRFIKVGTTVQTIRKRFSNKDYKKYSFIKFIYVAEVTSDKNPKDACLHVEDLTRSAIREMGGFTFIKNDRFQYFQLPDELPIYINLKQYKMVSPR